VSTAVLATFSIGAQQSAPLRAALCRLAAHATDEDGTELFEVHEDPEIPGDFVVFERYRDDEAVAQHRGSAAMAQFRTELAAIGARPQIRFLRPIAGVPIGT